MPIEIMEMLVKATVLEDRAETVKEKEDQSTQAKSDDREQLVRDVVEQVMEILQYQKER